MRSLAIQPEIFRNVNQARDYGRLQDAPTNDEGRGELDQTSSALEAARPPGEYFPDGGLNAWSSVAGGFLSFMPPLDSSALAQCSRAIS